MEILAEAHQDAMRVIAAHGVTSHRYDMRAIYQTVAKEGSERCKS